ncbi:MAG: amidohydrolase [Flavobacteriales bacterium]|nr:amidohydrolase [Flavobacteriales bacterium]
MKDIIKKKAEELYDEIRSVRQHIHKNPELSFKEFKTRDFLWEQLEKAGIGNKMKVAQTGIVALIEGRNPGKKTIALRGDMDALPIVEANDVPYKSDNTGIMHACGHDVHSSCLLGAGIILNSIKDEFEGTVKLIFQPGEEKLPGGASVMISEGVLHKPEVGNIFGQHVMPLVPVGKVGFRKGLYMASTDEIYMTIKGKGGHGAQPHQNVDPVTAMAQVITGLQQLVSRVAMPTIPSVLSFGKIEAKGATNIIPNEVYLEGTFRTLDEDWRAKAHVAIERIAKGICEALGCECGLEIRKGYPFLKNDPELTERSISRSIEYMGRENVVDLDVWMAAEDFAYYSQEIPACFYRLGTRNESKNIVSNVHTPTFDIDEDAIPIGVGLMAWLAYSELNG